MVHGVEGLEHLLVHAANALFQRKGQALPAPADELFLHNGRGEQTLPKFHGRERHAWGVQGMQEVGGARSRQRHHKYRLLNRLPAEPRVEQPIQCQRHVVDQHDGREKRQHETDLPHSVPSPSPHALAFQRKQP